MSDNIKATLIFAAFIAIAAIVFIAGRALATGRPLFGCAHSGKCMCFESVSPKGVIGYETRVSVTCINMTRSEVNYFDDVPDGAIRGTYAGIEPAH